MSNDQHWAEIAADKLISSSPEQELFTVASGMTPSGQMHIGHFREVMTTWLVKNALEDRGKNTRFILSWDSFDVFRKIPSDFSDFEKKILTRHLRKSISDVSLCFYKNEEVTYADVHISNFENSLKQVDINPEYIYQNEKYQNGDYVDGITNAIDNRNEICEILNKHRKIPLEEDWIPLAGFCDNCGKDNIEIIPYNDGPSRKESNCLFRKKCFDCKCISKNLFENETNIKLPWRIDWPMRWAYEKVDFEPGGKDHSSDGGSYDTGKEIVKLFGWKAPQYLGYNFVKAKGQGGKLSSSAGNLITLDDTLEIYEPEIIKWMFASYRPNAEFQISFDVDVIKLYSDYDKALALALKEDVTSKAATKQKLARKIFKLTKNYSQSILPSFRELSMTLQIYDGDRNKTLKFYDLKGKEKDRLNNRLKCVANWLDKYAPEEFKYEIRKTPIKEHVSSEVKKMLESFCNELSTINKEENQKVDLRKICEGTSLNLKEFSKIIYKLIIGRDNGPPIPTLIQTVGPIKLANLIFPSIDRVIITERGTV